MATHASKLLRLHGMAASNMNLKPRKMQPLAEATSKQLYECELTKIQKLTCMSFFRAD